MDTGYARDLLAALPLLECLTLQGELPALLWDGEGWLEGSHTCRVGRPAGAALGASRNHQQNASSGRGVLGEGEMGDGRGV